MRTHLRLLIAVLAALWCSTLAPVLAAGPPDPRFGLVEAYVNPAAASEAGAGYTRVILRWDVIQPGSALDWKPANLPDPLLQRELDAGRQVVGLLIGTPDWASTDTRFGSRAVPRMDAWAAFTRRMAQHYRGRIADWVIWNEPDVWDLAHPGNTWAGSERDYYELLKVAFTSIKGEDPAARVAMAGLTYFWDAEHGRRPFLDRTLDLIAADPEAAEHGYYFDAVVYHLYFNPLHAAQVIGEAQAALKAHGLAGKAIWVNETNAPPSDDRQELPWSAPRFRISLSEQAGFVIQQFALAFAQGAERVEFYKLRNSADHPESIEPFGLLRSDDSPRPAFAAYQAATEHLSHFRAVLREREGEVWAVTFDRGERTTIVLWTMGRAPGQARVRAGAERAQLVDEGGRANPIAALAGSFLVPLPGATCQYAGCGIGGAPRLLVVEARQPTGPVLLPSVPPPAPAGSLPPPSSPTSPEGRERPEALPGAGGRGPRLAAM